MEENKVDASQDNSEKKPVVDENNAEGPRPRRVREPRESNREPKEIIETRVSGTVKWYNVRDGYGFICRDSNNVDYFIHFSGIGNANPEHWQRSLEDGEKVLFDISKGNEKGKEAVNVTGLDGGQVQGSRFALDRARKPPKYILRGWQVPPKFLRRRNKTEGDLPEGEGEKDRRRRRSETYEEGEQRKKRSQKQRRRRQNRKDEEGKEGQSENEKGEEKTRKPRRPRGEKNGDDQNTDKPRPNPRRRPRAMKNDDDAKREDGAATGDEQSKPTADGKKPARRPRKNTQNKDGKEGTDDEDLGDKQNGRGRRYLNKGKGETEDEKKGLEVETTGEGNSVKKDGEEGVRQQLADLSLGKMHGAGDAPAVDEKKPNNWPLSSLFFWRTNKQRSKQQQPSE